MSLIVKPPSKKQYELPPEGSVNATLAEIEDLGEVQTNYGMKEKLVFKWETDQVGKDGKPLRVFQRFTKSTHPKAQLHKTIRAITGEAPRGDEDYDLESLLGTSVELVIQYNEAEDGRVFANIAAILRPKTQEEEASEQRVQAVIDATRRRGLHRDGSIPEA